MLNQQEICAWLHEELQAEQAEREAHRAELESVR